MRNLYIIFFVLISISGTPAFGYDTESLLYAWSVFGLIFSGNTLIRGYRFKLFHPRKYVLSLQYCDDMEISDNVIAEDLLGKNIIVKGMKKRDVKMTIGQPFDLEVKNE